MKVGLPGIDKTESGYDKIQRQVLRLRRIGGLHYRHIADLTRWMRKPTTFDSVEDALQATARLYRKALWHDAENYIEIWCEKDALAGVIFPVTAVYDVPLMVARGFSSETFCFEAIEARSGDARPYIVYYLGDFDRAGQDAAASLREKLKRFASGGNINIEFVHLAIAEDDIIEFDASTGLVHTRLGAVDRRLSDSRAEAQIAKRSVVALSLRLRAGCHRTRRSARPGAPSDRAAPAGGTVEDAEDRRAERARADRRPRR